MILSFLSYPMFTILLCFEAIALDPASFDGFVPLIHLTQLEVNEYHVRPVMQFVQ